MGMTMPGGETTTRESTVVGNPQRDVTEILRSPDQIKTSSGKGTAQE